jgi:hypothetical protein
VHPLKAKKIIMNPSKKAVITENTLATIDAEHPTP